MNQLSNPIAPRIRAAAVPANRMPVPHAIRTLVTAALLGLLLSPAATAQTPSLPAFVSPEAAAGPTWRPFNVALDVAKRTGKIALIDVWSASCGWCARMQREVYTRPELLEYLDAHFVTGRLDINMRTDTVSYMEYRLSSAELSSGFGATGTPTTVFLTSDGSYITRLPGFVDFEGYMDVLRFIATESFREMTFQEYTEKNKS